MKRWFKQAALIGLALFVLSGCSLGGGNSGNENKEQTLRVMYYDESSFYQQYGMLFSALHPNITIEVVSSQGVQPKEGEDYQELMNKFIEEEQPDILMLSVEEYEKKSLAGELYELDGYIAKDKYDTEGLVPGILDYLKEKGGGKLYGLTPGYYGQAIYYNKDLFDKSGIEYPTDRMSYEQILQLAKRFPTDGSDKERVYGLKLGYNDSLLSLGNTLAAAQNLSFINADKLEMTIDTEGWKKVFQTAMDAMESKSLYIPNHDNMGGSQSYEDYLLSDPFLAGRLAMTMDGPNLMQQIKQAKDYLKDENAEKLVKNWDLVTMPVDPQNPDYGTGISMNNLFSINGQSPNKDAAWTFIKYITGDDYARVTSKSSNYGTFPIRTKYMVDEDGRNLAAFYALKPSPFNMYKGYEKVPDNFYMEFNGAAEQELTQVKEGKATLDEALAKLQTIGQGILSEAKSKEESGKTTGDAESGGVQVDQGVSSSDSSVSVEATSP